MEIAWRIRFALMCACAVAALLLTVVTGFCAANDWDYVTMDVALVGLYVLMTRIDDTPTWDEVDNG